MEHAPQAPTQNQQPLENIILVGFMGSGKSSLGRELHQNLGYQLIDTDHVIEKQTGKSIPDIFSQDGEAAFRNLETEQLKQLIAEKTSQAHYFHGRRYRLYARKQNHTSPARIRRLVEML